MSNIPRMRFTLTQLWRHIIGPLGVLLVLVSVCGMGGVVKAWQDTAEIARMETRLRESEALAMAIQSHTVMLQRLSQQLDQVLAQQKEKR